MHRWRTLDVGRQPQGRVARAGAREVAGAGPRVCRLGRRAWPPQPRGARVRRDVCRAAAVLARARPGRTRLPGDPARNRGGGKSTPSSGPSRRASARLPDGGGSSSRSRSPRHARSHPDCRLKQWLLRYNFVVALRSPPTPCQECNPSVLDESHHISTPEEDGIPRGGTTA